MNNKTKYIAPVSLWLVVRKRFQRDGLFIEPAWVGSSDTNEQGPVLFASRIHAEVYAYMRNAHHQAGDSSNWKTIALQEFDLLGHARGLGGKLNCMMAFGFSMENHESIIVATGAPRIRYVPLPFELPLDIDRITFSFDQWVFTFMNEQWSSIGVPGFERDLEKADGMDDATVAQAVKVAIANAKVCRTPTANELWGVYSVLNEKWVSGVEMPYIDKTVH